MTQFFVVAAALVAASLAFVLWPLWRAGRPIAGKRREANITIYHQRYAEIEREVAAGRLGRRDAEQEKDELGARLLADIDETPSLAGAAEARRRPWLVTLLVVALICGGAGGGYWALGDWSAIRASDMPDIDTMIGELKTQVNAHPDDLQSLAMLARAQQATGDYAAAADSYERLNAALPEPQAPLLAAQAEARLQASDDLQGATRDLYRRVLDLDPGSAEALWYLGLAAAERNDNSQAIAYWDRLLKQDLPDDFRATVRNRRNELSGAKPRLEAQ